MKFTKLLRYYLSASFMALLLLFSAQDLAAKESGAGNFRTENTDEDPNETDPTRKVAFIKQSLDDKSLVKIEFDNPYISKYGKDITIYRAYLDYYDKFSYKWKDANGVEHTSKITERATDRNQIIALLTEIYTNPNIPGFVEDVSYLREDRDYDNNYYDDSKYQEIHNGKNIINADNTYKSWTTSEEDGFYGAKGDFLRTDYTGINYPAQDFYPYYIKEAPKTPINGATALLVEMKSDYYQAPSNGQRPYPNPLGGLHPGNLNSEVDNALNYIDAVTLITNERYLDEGGGTDNQRTGNPGFMFNIEGYFAKCFIITKGSPRPDKALPHPGWYSEEQEHKDYNYIRDDEGNLVMLRGGIPFYDMFEEFSPANDGPMAGAFNLMNNGEAFYVDHNCSSVTMQQHNIIMGDIDTKEKRQEKYHINLMFFLPDLRFGDNTSLKPGDRRTPGKIEDYYLYSPYTFYAADHRPYFFFNKIEAEIDGAVTLHEEMNNDGVVRTKAWVPVLWESNYKDIIKQQVPESFWIYRVVNGAVDPQPIPLNEIKIRQTGNKQEDYRFIEEGDNASKLLTDRTWCYYATDNPGHNHAEANNGSLIRAWDHTVTVYVVEDYDSSKDQGKEVSYVIRGRRKDSVFNLVESNVVTAMLPYHDDKSYMTLNLHRAKSDYDINEQRNVYSNTVNCIRIPDAPDGTPTLTGNLLASVLFTRDNDGKAKVRPGTFNIYRSLERDVNAPVESKTCLYSLNFDEKSVLDLYGNSVTVVRLVDDNTLKFINDYPGVVSTGTATEDGLGHPFRALAEMRDNGLSYTTSDGVTHSTDVKVAMVFKLSDLYIPNSELTRPWDPLGGRQGVADEGNGNLLGFFVDDNAFVQSTADNKIIENYYYYIEFVPEDEVKAYAEDVDEAGTDALISNVINVRVPLRPLYAGYLTYSPEQIEDEVDAVFNGPEDMYDHLLPFNSKGVGLKVSNSALVKNYDIYRLPREGETEKVLVARVWRNQDGSFQPRVFDGISNNDDSAKDAGDPTDPNYVGKIPMELIADIKEGDRFAVIIHSIDNLSDPYHSNTYGARFAYLHEYPTLSLSGFDIRRSSGAVSDFPIMDGEDIPEFFEALTSYQASVVATPGFINLTTGEPVNVSDYYSEFKYGIWSYEESDGTQYVKGTAFPSWAEFENRYHWISPDNSSSAPKNIKSSAPGSPMSSNLSYEFKHQNSAPTANNPIVTTNVVRLYAKLNPEYSASNDDEYVVVDAVAHYGTFGNGSTTGVEDVVVDNNAVYRYFNLQGVQVDANRLAPGIYVRTNGRTAEKVIIR